MIYSEYELLWLFLVYSFWGWVIETVVAALKQKHFVNRGLVNAPFCVIYGFTAVIVTIFFNELHGFWLFVGSMILSTLIEWLAGRFIEKIYHEKWWDYSNIKWNLDGYICLPMSVFWGILCVFVINYGNPFLINLFIWIPHIFGKLIVWVLSLTLIADIVATLCILTGRSRKISRWKNVDSWLTSISSKLGRCIYGWVDRRIQKAYPHLSEKGEKRSETANTNVFAYGCSFHKILWIFVIGAFLGDIVETIFCRFSMGFWMSRSSVVWGPFSLVWGIALAVGTLLLYKYKNRSDSFIFLIGTFLGGAYEYICSIFTEIVFGKVFWDYSHIPFNLGGRVNLLYCFFWGIAAVIWIKKLYPFISLWIERIPKKVGKFLSWVLVVFFCCNIIVSCMALIRSDQRHQGMPAENTWQEIMDENYSDNRLKEIYPNAVEVN